MHHKRATNSNIQPNLQTFIQTRPKTPAAILQHIPQLAHPNPKQLNKPQPRHRILTHKPETANLKFHQNNLLIRELTKNPLHIIHNIKLQHHNKITSYTIIITLIIIIK